MKKSFEHIKNAFKRWNSGNSDLLANIDEHREYEDRLLEKKQKSAWEPRPIKRIETLEIRSFEKLYYVLSVVLCLTMIAVLLITVSYLPRYGSEYNPDNNEVSERYIEKGLEETGAVNIVAGMILDYRAFDTLGESCVLFTAACAVLILLRRDKDSQHEESDDAVFDLLQDNILKNAARVVVPAVFLFGLYIMLNGHLSPGGGFSGGAVMGAGLILYSIAYGFERSSKLLNAKTYSIIVVSALCFYAVLKGYSFFMGANGMENGIPLGIPGNILSSGLILPLNIAVGFIVTCTMYGFYSLFKRGRI